jgi:DNA adenine methylase Dam
VYFLSNYFDDKIIDYVEVFMFANINVNKTYNSSLLKSSGKSLFNYLKNKNENCVNQYIKSPINYTGNKYRILSQITQYFPKNIDHFVDMFTGGATVGININAKKITMIDNDKKVIKLLEYLTTECIENILQKILNIIFDYKLSCSSIYSYKYYRNQGCIDGNNGLKNYNKKGFYNLRSEYNMLNDRYTNNACAMLYVLMIYGFNNDLRFNANGEYNLPVGKTDLNTNNIEKLIAYNKVAQNKNIEFACTDFSSEKSNSILHTADYSYFDPPYLITDATYNTTSSWDNKQELKLIDLLINLNNKGCNFSLSNVLSKVGKKNNILESFIQKTINVKVVDINYSYKSASYNKKNRNAKEREVLIYNV